MIYHLSNDILVNTPDKNGCYITEDGTKHYYRNNGLHRLDGPASEWNGTKYWYRNNGLHRLDGPAVEKCDGSKLLYLFGIMYKEVEYNKLVSNIPLLYWKNRDNL